MKNLHSWDVLAVCCIDGRFVKRTVDWVAKEMGGVFDFRTEVGSSKAIIDSKEDRDRFFEVIRTSIKLHNVKEVWLIDHIDCGAYGGSEEHDGEGDEKNFHIEKLNEAEKIVKAEFPELTVKKIYVGWENVEVI